MNNLTPERQELLLEAIAAYNKAQEATAAVTEDPGNETLHEKWEEAWAGFNNASRRFVLSFCELILNHED